MTDHHPLAGGVEATFIVGSPARLSHIALWPTNEPNASLPLALGQSVAELNSAVELDADAEGALLVEVPVRLVSLSAILDELVRLDPREEFTDSVHAWSLAARAGLEALSRGHLEAWVTPEGHDAWRLGPRLESDRSAVEALGGWLPPTAHCTAVDGSVPLRMTDPRDAVSGLWDAIADLLPRTAAADQLYEHGAWTSSEVHDVSELAAAVNAVTQPPVAVSLRLSFPSGPEDPFGVELLVRSVEDPSKVALAAAVWAGTSVGFGPSVEKDLLVSLRRGARVFPPLERLLEQSEPCSMLLHDDEAMALLGPVSAQLEMVGLEVQIPRDVTRTLRTAAHIERVSVAAEGPANFDLAALCELTWRPTLGGEPVSVEELAQLAEARRPLVYLRGEWVVADPRLLEKLKQRRQLTTGEALAAALAEDSTHTGWLDSSEEFEFGPQLVAMVQTLRSFQQDSTQEAPSLLEATLRPYQLRGLTWLKRMADSRLGGVLADDMGLGKTIQVIALHLLRVAEGNNGRMLVVCPATLVSNWEREFARFAPTVTVARYHGLDRSIIEAKKAQVVVTTYGIVRRDAETLAEVEWDIVIADEAQQVKNPASGTARALRTIESSVRFGLTGTPVENRLGDLWALLDWTTPTLLGSQESFRQHVAVPVERDRDGETLERFGRVIAPFVLRRRKIDPDIAPDLPPKTETDHPVALTAEQAGLYRAAVDKALSDIAGAEGIRRRGLVLKLLTELKQICNHPAHFLNQQGPLAGRSGKMELADELLTAISDAGDSTLIFTQFVEMGHLLTRRLGELGLSSGFLHGSLTLAHRGRLVDDFQSGGFQNFVVSLKAGGTGLNLTAATHVIHYDRWWNPAVENQASDRAWRIGQDRPVQIHRLISDGTLEERIATVLAEKLALAEAAVGTGEAWLTELTDNDLRTLLTLGGD